MIQRQELWFERQEIYSLLNKLNRFNQEILPTDMEFDRIIQWSWNSTLLNTVQDGLIGSMFLNHVHMVLSSSRLFFFFFVMGVVDIG